jgi:hypothetical protein
MSETDSYYVSVPDHTQLRRFILECSKQILQSLQDYETVQSIREEKIKLILELRRLIKEIYSLNAKLAGVMPRAQLRASSEDKSEFDILAPRKSKADLNSFEDELRRIEEKLNLLGA